MRIREGTPSRIHTDLEVFGNIVESIINRYKKTPRKLVVFGVFLLFLQTAVGKGGVHGGFAVEFRGHLIGNARFTALHNAGHNL